ncbi:hypothetical protein HYPSUDRAFT_205614 [Hypholoma sublateritium FD-334 SS-4]|uniref:Uncharacterized protein n=1 Tax=Hypholoma sublateritium (strain FD-334 SS-4) TaxID=945553 RepID=A0A0D2NMY5_HYPSF|nr:hypothetical protein HYPSUDRAFT_205614 [Hypholoma sublateritium FD-334 SS-4]
MTMCLQIMDSSSSFSGIITGGIQDISALLPLLGTEQCEKHVGSALDRGFLYSSVTPISIFGSIGIVRAAFNILIASIDIRRYRFLGAQKLSDGGFNASGVVAPMIALDPRYPKRFLAESRLETMLTDEHIEKVEDLTVSWAKGTAWWNFLPVVLALFVSVAGILPYVSIIHGSRHNTIRSLFPFGFGFPVLRVVGSILCMNVAQFLIQIRIMVLLKTRLLFVAIDRLAREADIDLEFELNPKTRRKNGKARKSMWSSELASEKCIWTLEKWLAAETQTVAAPKKANDIPTVINNIYISQRKRQLDALHKTIPRWIKPILCFGLVAGIFLTVAGYIGCFYLIQHSSDNSTGPLLWLILEALLSIIRILVWSVSPSWDVSKGIVFELQLASHAPLITCNKYEHDIADDGVAPVTRANTFLEEVVAYTGPLLPLFDVDNVALYYILTAKAKGPPQSVDTLPHGKLYIVISDFREGTSRILCKQDSAQSTFSVYLSTLEPVPESTVINVRAKLSKEGITEPKTHFLTADASFMEKLMVHYNKILSALQKQRSNLERGAVFSKTWALQQLGEEGRGLENNAALNSGPGSVENRILLTNEDMAYLRQGQIERRWREMYSHLEEWVELYIDLYTKELLEDVPVDLVFKEKESVNIVQKYEANEVEYLLIECRTFLEQLLLSTAAKWNEFMEMDFQNMVDVVIQGMFSDAVSLKELSESSRRYSEEIRKNKLESRLADEWHGLLEKETRSRRQNMRSRLMAQADSTEQRIQGRKYNDPTGETIMKTWRSLEDEINSGSSSQSAASSDAGSPESQGRSSDSSANSDAKSQSNVRGSGYSLSSSTSKHSQDDEAVVDESNHAQKNPLAARQDAFIKKMQTRFLEIDGENKNKSELQLMKARCYQRIDRLFSRMEDQMTEFKELLNNDILTADSHELVEYWRIESLRERRRLLDRTQKCLVISDASIQAVGGKQNMARALMRSQEYSFLDANESTLFTAKDLVAIVKCLKSVAGVASSLRGEALKEILEALKTKIHSALAAKKDVCLYGNAIVTDYYRKGYPYLLLKKHRGPSCIVYFHIHKKCDHNLTLRHCMTTSNVKVAISLNKHPLERTWGRSQAVKFNFVSEDVRLPEAYLMDVGQTNILTIAMEDSRGGYWLSDVFLPVQPTFSSTIATL